MWTISCKQHEFIKDGINYLCQQDNLDEHTIKEIKIIRKHLEDKSWNEARIENNVISLLFNYQLFNKLFEDERINKMIKRLNHSLRR